MPRSSRHKSHRPHKHNSRDARDRSDSEDERKSRERKPKEEPEGTGSGTRVSRDQEQDKWRQGKDVSAPGNGDFSGEHGKKRKDRDADGEGFEPLDSEKTSKAKASAVDSKSRSRRHDGSGDKKEDSGGKDESLKRRSEKDSGRRESSSHYKDAKERDRERDRGSERERERGSEREKKAQDARQEKSDDVGYRKQGTRTSGTQEERSAKMDVENTGKIKPGLCDPLKSSELQVQDELCSLGLEKELDKRIRRDGSGDKDKRQGDGKYCDDRCLSSRDDHAVNDSLRNEKHRDGRLRHKYREDLKRDEKHQDNKSGVDPSSSVHNIDKSDNKLCRSETMCPENQQKKCKMEENDHDSSFCIGTKYKDIRGRKRSSDENDAQSGLKLQTAKEPRTDGEKDGLGNSKQNSNIDRGRQELIQSDKADSTLSSNRSKSSPSSSSHVVKDPYRHSSKQADSARRNSLHEERLCPSTASSDLASILGDHGADCGVSDPRTVGKLKEKEDFHSNELLVENAASSHYERTPRSDSHTSPLRLTEKSPSSTTDRQILNKTDDKRGFDDEDMGHRGSRSRDCRNFSTSEDREREFLLEKLAVNDNSQAELLSSGSIPVGSSSLTRADHLSRGSPGHLPPPPPVRLGIDSPSVLASFGEDNRSQGGDRRSSSRYRRNGDMNMGRGQGHAWKGLPNWPSPIANGFNPFQHGPPPGGFHPAVQQYPPQSLFGVRPSMDFNHAGVPYHMHENPGRFSSHGHPFGWRNPVIDSCPPHLQGWDGSNGIFADESHMYGRPDWEHNRHVMGSHGWEMNGDMWKGQNGSLDVEFPIPQQEPDYSAHAPADEAQLAGQSGQRSRKERSRSERLRDESFEIKRSNGAPAMNAAEMPPKIIQEKMPEPSKTSIDDVTRFSCTYLSRLDISHELAHTELYKKCTTLVGTEKMTEDCNVSEHRYPQNLRKANKMISECFNHDLSSTFPPITDAVFKKAMSLFKKQNEEMRVNISFSFLHPKENKYSPMTSDVEKIELGENLISSENPSLADVGSPSNMGVESNTSPDAKGNIIPCDAKEQLYGTAITNVALAEGSFQACEDLMPECRVNEHLRRPYLVSAPGISLAEAVLGSSSMPGVSFAEGSIIS